MSFTDKIDSSTHQHSSPLFFPSEPPLVGSLNSSPAPARKSFSSPTILSLAATTASTNQSAWLPSPAPAPASSPAENQNQQLFQPQGDFVLFDQQTHQQPQRRQPDPTQLGHTFSTGNGQQFYSNSAPSSTVNIRPQTTRPPVPLFNSNSTGNIHQIQPTQRNTMTDFATSFDSLDASFGAGMDATTDFAWESNFTAINTGVSSAQTVSPKDLFNDGLGSAPPSTAFTNLTSPDINESPYIADSYECSPLFQDSNDIGADTNNWYSLFPDSTEKSGANPMERQTSNVSLGEQTSSSGNSPLVMDATNYRRQSSNPMSPRNSAVARHSSSAGVKKRRNKGPLPPIEVDPGDKIALKRARNTLAARDSRQRKLVHVEALERRIAELEEREQALKDTLANLGYNGPLLQ